MASTSSRIIKTIIYILIGAAIIGVIYVVFFQPKKESNYVTAKATKAGVNQSVALTGTVEPLTRYELQFTKTGKIKKNYVKVGEAVKTGEVLSTLENTDTNYQLEAQKAALRLAQANLSKAMAGPHQEDVDLGSLKIQQAEETLSYAIENAQRNNDLSSIQFDNAQIATDQSNETYGYTLAKEGLTISGNQQLFLLPAQNTLHAFQNALTEIDKILGINTQSVLGNSYFLLGGGNNGLIQNAKNLFNIASQNIANYQTSVLNLSTTPTLDQINAVNTNAQNAQSSVISALVATQNLLKNTQTNATFTDAQRAGLIQEIDANFTAIQQNYQALIQAYQTIQNNQNNAGFNGYNSEKDTELKQNNQEIVSIQGDMAQNNGDKAINDAQSALDQAKQQLNILLAQPRNVDLEPLQAQVDQAWQNVHLAEYQVAQTQLKAPTDGLVTDIKTSEGETVNLTQPFIIIDTKSKYIKALISEADISKIKKDQNVTITFDAFDVSKEFQGTVSEIYPAETIVQGVVYYEVKIKFDPKDTPVKPGMTANLTIKTEEKSAVLTVPNRAVQYDGNQAYVQILKHDDKNNEIAEKRNVTTGLQGDENIEILSGLQEGEDVITFTKTS